jgi:uncharacterized protein
MFPNCVRFGKRSVHRRLRTMRAMLRKRVLGGFLALSSLAIPATSLATASRASAVSPNVVISQIYGGGGNTGATYKNDYIELFNKSSAAVNLTGWSVQYASSTGVAWQITNLSGTLAAGAYYLIQEAAGTGGTVNLPNPDAFGTIAMSGTTAKIALRNTTTACSGTCSALPNTVDFVGYGSANDFEGTVGPATSNTAAILRAGTPRGAQDTDNNATDFSSGAPSPLSSGGSGGGGVTLIHDIQGTGFVSPKAGQTITIEGIVTGVDDKIGYDNSPCTAYPRDAGIFVQEEDADADADPNTSEGIFVGNVSPRANYPVGSKVRLTGLVKDGGGSFPPFDQTRMEVSSAPTILASGQPLPTAVTINAAATVAQTGAREYYETLEGMRVTLASGVANAGGTNKFNELFLEPGTAIDTMQRTDVASRLNSRIGLVDDAGAGNPTNPLLEYPSTSRVLADKGDTVINATGPLDYGFSNYKIVVQPGDTPTVNKTGVAYPYNRLAAKTANQVRIASFNVENLFPTGGSLDCTTITSMQYNEKRADVVDAIGRLLQAPDIVAVQEIGDLRGATPSSLAVLQDVATDLGTATFGTFSAHAVEGNDNRGIDVGFLVKNTVTVNSVTQYGKTEANPTASTCADVAGLLFDRPPLVLDATLPGTGGNLLVITSHFSSKAAPDACRVAQATYIRNLVKGFETAQPTRKVIVTGDINAFEDEGALTALGDPTQTTLTNLWSTTPEPERYSFQFSGLLQTLDHLLVNAPVQPMIAGFQYVHFDNDYFHRTGVADGHKVSDHDPPILTLNVGGSTPPPASTGFDNVRNVVVAGGSDTTYFISNLLGNMYNQSPGCAVNLTVSPVDNCTSAGNQSGGASYANWDHDVFVNAFPVGSANGRNQIAGALSGTNALDLVRSSSGVGTTAGVSLYEFASEAVGVVVVNPAARARVAGSGGFNASKAQLQQIYGPAPACSAVTWAMLGDTGPNAADSVLPFGMNGGSGTYEVFKTYLGIDPNAGGCVSGTPFENDVAELKKLDVGGTDNLPRYNSGRGLWWISGATLSGFPVLAATLSPTKVDGFGYADPTNYPIIRNVSFVARTADAPFTVAGPGGTTGGKPGAVREFLRWVCRTGTSHAGDTNIQTQPTARRLDLQITGAVQRAGFNPSVVPLTAGTTSFGRCRGK